MCSLSNTPLTTACATLCVHQLAHIQQHILFLIFICCKFCILCSNRVMLSSECKWHLHFHDFSVIEKALPVFTHFFCWKLDSTKLFAYLIYGDDADDADDEPGYQARAGVNVRGCWCSVPYSSSGLIFIKIRAESGRIFSKNPGKNPGKTKILLFCRLFMI